MNTLTTRTILLLAVLSGATSPAQVAWTQVATIGPSARTKHRMVYDSHRQRIVLFGGSTTSATSETWEWDGTAWAQQTPSVSPPARDEHGMAYDSRRQRVVVFGGRQGPLGDTWEYDGTTWTRRSPMTQPAPRWGHAMTFDSVRGVTVMHGGFNFVPTETWEWDGTDWRQPPAPNSPQREEHSIAFDVHRGRVVLFGGRYSNNYNLIETFEWDGSTWILRNPAISPPPRAHYAVAYDALRRCTVLFGGYPGLLADTWEWDGTSWLPRTPVPSPTAREQHAMAFDAGRGELLLFGGSGSGGRLGDTWRYTATNPASYTALGTGCAGSVGTPTLAPMPGHLPWLGDSLTLEVRNLPATAPVAYLFGNSNTAWGSLALPVNLTPVGMNGCVLRAAGIVTLPMVNQAGTASITFAIPTVRYLVRAPFYDQAFALDQQANPFGATLSNAGELRCGER